MKPGGLIMKTPKILCAFTVGLVMTVAVLEAQTPKAKVLMPLQQQATAVTKVVPVAEQEVEILEEEPVKVIPAKKDPKDFSTEEDFTQAYESLLGEYLEVWTKANQSWVEADSSISLAEAQAVAEIMDQKYSDAYSKPEVDWKKAELRANLQEKVEEVRSTKLNQLTADYNKSVSALDSKRTMLDNQYSSTMFVTRNLDLNISPWDSIDKSWTVKITSNDPYVMFSTDYLKISLDKEEELFVPQFEKINPIIKSGFLVAEVSYTVDIYQEPDAPEDSVYNRTVKRIVLFDKRSGNVICTFEDLAIPAGSTTWTGFKKRLFIDNNGVVRK